MAFKTEKSHSPLLSLPTQRKKPTCPLEYTPGGAGRFIPLTIRRCISVLLRSENILRKEKDKKAHSSHHQLIHCQTRVPWVFVRAFSIVHSLQRPSPQNIPEQGKSTNRAKNISEARNKAQEATGLREKHRGKRDG